jgi:hypothetical protein
MLVELGHLRGEQILKILAGKSPKSGRKNSFGVRWFSFGVFKFPRFPLFDLQFSSTIVDPDLFDIEILSFFSSKSRVGGVFSLQSRLEPSKSRLGGEKRDFEARLGGKNKNLEVK